MSEVILKPQKSPDVILEYLYEAYLVFIPIDSDVPKIQLYTAVTLWKKNKRRLTWYGMYLPQPISIGPSLEKGDQKENKKQQKYAGPGFWPWPKEVGIIHLMEHQKGGSLETQGNRQQIWLSRRKPGNQKGFCIPLLTLYKSNCSNIQTTNR